MSLPRLLAVTLAAGLAAAALPAPLMAQAAASNAPAADAPPLIPGAVYDNSVPTVSAVLGYDSGERISRSADVLRYFEALRAAAPDRVVMGEQARTHEGRPGSGPPSARPPTSPASTRSRPTPAPWPTRAAPARPRPPPSSPTSR